MGIGIALGNTVDSVGPALQKGEFVGVSVPIGMFPVSSLYHLLLTSTSYLHDNLPPTIHNHNRKTNTTPQRSASS
jgi:hypothetical protein